jgi:hypothetical protein
LARI